MKTSTKLLSGTFALLVAVVATTSSASAYRGDSSVQGPNYSAERHAEMTEAFETNNYDAWVNLMDGRGRVIQVVNAGNFSRFAEAHKLAQEGNFEASKAIRTELGLGLQNGSGKGQGQGSNGRRNGSKRGRNQSGARDGSGARGGTSECTYNN